MERIQEHPEAAGRLPEGEQGAIPPARMSLTELQALYKKRMNETIAEYRAANGISLRFSHGKHTISF